MQTWNIHKMKLRTSLRATPPFSDYYELWALRLLIESRLWRYVTAQFISECSICDDSPVLTRLNKYCEDLADIERRYRRRQNAAHHRGDDPEDLPLPDLHSAVRRLRTDIVPPEGQPPAFLTEALEKASNDRSRPEWPNRQVAANLTALQKTFGLSGCETKLLFWIIWLRQDTDIRNLINAFDFSKGGLELYADVFACACEESGDEALKALSGDGRLFSSGLVCTVRNRAPADAEDWFCFFDPVVAASLLTRPIDVRNLLGDSLRAAPAAKLALADFRRLPETETIILPYLRKALDTRRPGVNVLVYGPPGTGKTELSRVLAAEIGAEAWEVAVSAADNDNEQSGGPDRLRYWRLADRILRGTERSILVMDEAEDVFNSSITFGNQGYARRNKGEINALLEENAVPTIWITNSLSMMDPAMLRRFDVILEVPLPDEDEKIKIVRNASEGMLSDAACRRLAKTEKLAPAVITRTVSVVRELDLTEEAERDEKTLQLIASQLRAQQLGRIAPPEKPSSSVYSVDYLCTGTDLTRLAEGIRKTGQARLCLYGPPGTGKSAWAAKLAETLGRPLIVRTASSLLSCWVGETEARIAEAFAEAARTEAVLLIDEADSFLQARSGSRQGWEITQVNEMLTQIEAFDGIFIATTNLIDTMDEASLRRFDMKIRFDVLDAPQARALFCAHADALGIGKPEDAVLSRVAAIGSLTPGDFASVVRRASLLPIRNPADFAGRLEDDCRLKKDKGRAQRRIGF